MIYYSTSRARRKLDMNFKFYLYQKIILTVMYIFFKNGKTAVTLITIGYTWFRRKKYSYELYWLLCLLFKFTSILRFNIVINVRTPSGLLNWCTKWLTVVVLNTYKFNINPSYVNSLCFLVMYFQVNSKTDTLHC